MATIVLSAAGMALGGSLGGSVLGLSAATLGRAAGAMVGRAIDERLLGAGSAPVETGRIDRFRLTGASEGAAVARVHGAVRVGGQVIWASPFKESSATSGGKGSPQPQVTTYGYTVSLAVALCEGVIAGIGRVWADGQEIARGDLQLSVYHGTEDQLPDPRIEAEEGPARVSAHRGIAYVVIEDLPLERFGNRVPQFSFEVFRPALHRLDAEAEDIARLLRGVALIPGTGEYALATTPVYLSSGFGQSTPANVNTAQARPDFLVSLDQLTTELPRLQSISLVVCWFGDDLRAGHCQVQPKVEQTGTDGQGMPWSVSGLPRAQARRVPREDGRPVYGGTPTDASVIQAIREIRERGKAVTFYPFLLMDQMPGNGLPDPYGAAEQPALPWRGRITLSKAPGRPGSPDLTAEADAEVAAFFGSAQPGQFARQAEGVAYTGPAEWSFRRMILHYAHLCAEAGGVDAFCIGTEMRGLTTIRGADGFPAVDQLRRLAREVKAILPGATITYAADWSEYSGYQPAGTADKLFHLDPLWADDAIDVIGLDNYLPLSDWREGDDHLDAAWGDVHSVDYLAANVAGGELHDWFYASEADRAAQVRTPIADGLGEPWLWRLKDLQGWWSNPHHDRVDGQRRAASPWVPKSKPIWFTEIGCAAIDKGTNEPNKFLDPKSSESMLPRFSDGRRDDLIQQSYYRALFRHWADPSNNPVSPLYGGAMVDMDRAHAWAWDARPFPAFPATTDLWGDGPNYDRGHWLNGRASARTLASVVEEICRDSGAAGPDTSCLHGLVRGMVIEDAGTAREALQPLMLAYGFDVLERDGRLVARTRTGRVDAVIEEALLVHDEGAESDLTLTRAPEAELAGRVQVQVIEHGADYASISVEAVLPDDPVPALSRNSLPLVALRAEGRAIAERWLHESRLGRDGARFALPPSLAHLGPGDVVEVGGASWRIDRVEDAGARSVEAVRVEPGTWRPVEATDEPRPPRPIAVPAPVEAVFLDLPLLTGEEAPEAPHVAFVASPWPGPVALASGAMDAGYSQVLNAPVPATVGTTLTSLRRAEPGIWDRGPALRVRLARGALASVCVERVLGGAGVAAIGDGLTDHWEVFQFAEAKLVAPSTWDLRLRLRGQAGTDAVMPDEWPAGSRFVLLDGVPSQWSYPASLRDRLRHYRWGPAGRPLSDPSWRHREVAFRGIGLRPYAVCHLRAHDSGGDLRVSWVRRTRIDGDSWTGTEVPLGEEREAYLLRVHRDGTVLREVEVARPAWTYDAAMRAEDGPGPLRIEVAQLSVRFGPGPFRSVEATA
ncbi:GTA host specificity protein [Rubellimicrobium mesophilum DSM 19309]|uniref:GTA host specificity protein n=1 Tax=Rubellimicrobium mesophilum DSM 19309 TaxID=442562 RepID=A0A017HJT3_9RHOB|nr:glycoside hydrolase/phage tail family protein [Rubellimicrobium mesophilum]EYD74428.1 GTA host specificity protein [Rubellimicrobium mesophilum DSM 19309]